jgi:hypothetical protein
MVNDAILDDAVEWFDRVGCVEKIRAAMKQRFGFGITKTADGYETYSRNGIQTEIDAGFYEAIDVGIGQRVVAALANLFSREDSSWQITTPSGDVDEESRDILSLHRDAGGYDSAMVAADQLSCAVESGCVRIRWEGGKLHYEPVAPQNVKILFGQYVIDDGVKRAPNTSEIDDASAVIVRLGGAIQSAGGAYDSSRWIAYLGRSEEYPDGRCVTYAAELGSYDAIPPFGAEGAIDVVRIETGEPCNPLSWIASHYPEYTGSEYPVTILRGGHVSITSSPLPTITSLYETAVELTLSWSRMLKDALSAVLGREVIKNPDAVALPEVTEGLIALKRGQEYEVKTMNPGSVTAAIDGIYAASGAVASGWNVPPYTVVSRIGAAPESGIALVVQTAPLHAFSNHRWRTNRHAVLDMFDVERGLLAYHMDDTAIPWDSVYSYNPGTLSVPQDDASRIAAVAAALDAGVIDTVEAIRRLSKSPNDETAEELYAKYRDRQASSPRLGQPAPRASVSLPPRTPR